MDIVTRLELNLKAAIGAAMADLIAADLKALWAALEPMLVALPNAEQLRLSGMAIAELAEICQLKAERLLTDWEEQHNETGPAMAEDLLAGLVQRTMYLEIADLVRQSSPLPAARPSRSSRTADATQVGIVEKSSLLALLAAESLDEPYQHAAALAMAHSENPSAWMAAVAGWMQAATEMAVDSVSLLELQRSLNLPLIELWLALLLGGYRLESRGGFYETEQIWITVV